MTRNFTCSVSEFTSSTGSIHVNSPNSVKTFDVSTRVYHEIMSFSRDDTCQCQTRSKLVTTGRTRVFTWIHLKTRTGGAVPIMNQYDLCQLVQKWFLVCWVYIYIYIYIYIYPYIHPWYIYIYIYIYIYLYIYIYIRGVARHKCKWKH